MKLTFILMIVYSSLFQYILLFYLMFLFFLLSRMKMKWTSVFSIVQWVQNWSEWLDGDETEGSGSAALNCIRFWGKILELLSLLGVCCGERESVRSWTIDESRSVALHTIFGDIQWSVFCVPKLFSYLSSYITTRTNNNY